MRTEGQGGGLEKIGVEKREAIENEEARTNKNEKLKRWQTRNTGPNNENKQLSYRKQNVNST